MQSIHPGICLIGFDNTEMISPSVLSVLATRGIGELRVLSDIPEIVVAVFRILTHLGSPYTLFAMISILYLFGRRGLLVRRRAAFILAIEIAAIAITVGLKHLFALPRPPVSYRSGFGFPSGHAIGTTVFWGAAALLTERWQWWRRVALAGGVIIIVAASRVIIGVHYVVDVFAGIAVGVALLALIIMTVGSGLEMGGNMSALVRPTHTDVTAMFGVAAILTISSIMIAPNEIAVLLGTGMAATGATIWHKYGRTFGAIRVPITLRAVIIGGICITIGFTALITTVIMSTTVYVAQFETMINPISIASYAIATGSLAAVIILASPSITARII